MRQELHRRLIASAGFALWTVGCQSFAGDQPQWGQAWSRNMVSTEKGLADSFDPATGNNVKWSADLGSETHSTPIVAGGRVFIGTNNDHPRDSKEQGDRGVLMCFDEQTGRFLWQLVEPKRDEDIYFDWPRSGIASPVTVEGDRVYVVSNRGEVLCLAARGKGQRAQMLWRFDLTTGAGIWSHDAAHSSILIRGDHLYLNSGTGVDNTHRRIRTPDAPSLVVLDKQTGGLVARDFEHIAPNIFHSTWSSPSLARVNSHSLLFFAAGNGVVYAFEPVEEKGVTGARRDGEWESWSDGVTGRRPAGVGINTPPPRRSNTPTLHHSTTPPRQPLVSLRRVWQFDFDPAAPKTNVHKYVTNRRESPSNFYGMPVFHQNRLYVAGGGDIWWGKNEAWLKCLDATKTGDVTTDGLVWSYPLQKHVLSTPAIFDGLVFIADCGRTFHCVDALTGKRCWTHEIEGEAWASPLVADGKVYLGTRRGILYIFTAAREKKLLAAIDLGSPISSTATAANGALYVATMSHLYAVEQKAR